MIILHLQGLLEVLHVVGKATHVLINQTVVCVVNEDAEVLG